MRPVNFSKRAGCHWHLSEILRVEKEFGKDAKDEKIIEFLDDDKRFYEQLEDFLDLVFEEKCAASMAVFQYFCAKYRICYSYAPAYMDYMPKLYENYDDLNDDIAEYRYLSTETKNKLKENEKLEEVCKEWQKTHQDRMTTIIRQGDTINSLHREINDMHEKEINRIITEREKHAKPVTDENVTQIKLLTEQLAEKDKQIEALMNLLQKQKDTQQ